MSQSPSLPRPAVDRKGGPSPVSGGSMGGPISLLADVALGGRHQPTVSPVDRPHSADLQQPSAIRPRSSRSHHVQDRYSMPPITSPQQDFFSPPIRGGRRSSQLSQMSARSSTPNALAHRAAHPEGSDQRPTHAWSYPPYSEPVYGPPPAGFNVNPGPSRVIAPAANVQGWSDDPNRPPSRVFQPSDMSYYAQYGYNQSRSPPQGMVEMGRPRGAGGGNGAREAYKNPHQNQPSQIQVPHRNQWRESTPPEQVARWENMRAGGMPDMHAGPSQQQWTFVPEDPAGRERRRSERATQAAGPSNPRRHETHQSVQSVQSATQPPQPIVKSSTSDSELSSLDENSDDDDGNNDPEYIPGAARTPRKRKGTKQSTSSPAARYDSVFTSGGTRSSARLRNRRGREESVLTELGPDDKASASGTAQPKRRTYVRRDAQRRKEQNAQAQQKFRLKKKHIAEQMKVDLEAQRRVTDDLRSKYTQLQRVLEEKNEILKYLRNQNGTQKRALLTCHCGTWERAQRMMDAKPEYEHEVESAGGGAEPGDETVADEHWDGDDDHMAGPSTRDNE